MHTTVTTYFPSYYPLLLPVLIISVCHPSSLLQQRPVSGVVSAFLVTPRRQLLRTRSTRRSHSTLSLISGGRAVDDYDDDEADWLTIKRKKEQEQKVWARKIKEKNERKAKAKGARSKSNGSNSSRLVVENGESSSSEENNDGSNDDDTDDTDTAGDAGSTTCSHYVSKDAVTFAQAHSAELIALAGPQFDGATLGVGGLDEVIAEIKRRIWTPYAAPPSVMQELGITPVRGMILYGSSGCGKTLLARQIGQLLSKARPLTVVSGPQLMDKFVGSSEKNLREMFDNPPGVYDPYRISGGKGIDKAALHVIILDEFDAMARTRGGNDDGGTSSSAGVARDSVVNQILAKMDGVDTLEVPTLVIAMTNRPTLIDPALLRPGRFEVQIEVPPPQTTQARKSVLHVHMKSMHTSGRLEVTDAPTDTGYVSVECAKQATRTYEELLTYLADRCVGFSGASLAAVPRAAASRALERAVSHYAIRLNDTVQQQQHNTDKKTTEEQFNQGKQDALAMFDCVVSLQDLDCAVHDVQRSATITLQQQSQSPNMNMNTNTVDDDTDSNIRQQNNSSNNYDANGIEKEAVSLHLL